MVNCSFTVSFTKPGANIFTIQGINISKRIVKIISINVRSEIALDANFMESSFPDETNFDENNGTNADVNAPSAKRLLNRFGSLNDTKKASDTVPAPRKFAIIISRINPVIRLTIVNPPKVAIDFTKDIEFS